MRVSANNTNPTVSASILNKPLIFKGFFFFC
jgi:hypothetical protein